MKQALPVTAQIQAAREVLASAPVVTDAVIAKVKLCLLDFLGCAFESRNLAWSREAVHFARLPQACPPVASLIAAQGTATYGDAAFANGVMGHGLVREDMHSASISHLGIVMMPTLLALAQYKTVTGRLWIEAAVLGYEVGAQLGRVLMDPALARIHRPTGITGPVGAAAAGAHLLTLSEPALASAVGLSTNTTGGFNQWAHTGGSEMFFHPGFAARSAVTSVLLAEQGAFASPDAIDGQAGLFASLRKPEAHAAFKMFSGDPEILAVYHKPVPACNFAQTATQAALEITRQYEIKPEQIQSIEIRVPRSAALYPGCDFTGPFDHILQAKMSIQFNVVAALLYRAVSERNFEDLNMTMLVQLLSRTTMQIDPEMTQAYPAQQGGEVTVVMKDGQRHGSRLENVVNATFEQVLDRFRLAASEAIGSDKSTELEKFIHSLDTCMDVGRIGSLLQSQTNV